MGLEDREYIRDRRRAEARAWRRGAPQRRARQRWVTVLGVVALLVALVAVLSGWVYR